MKLRKKVMTLLAVCMLAVPTIASAATSKDFKDLPKTDDHYKAVMALVNQGIIDGYPDGTFRPYQDISRQHIAVLLKRALSLPTPSDKETKQLLSSYKDVNTNHAYAKEIAAVRKAGIIAGNADGYFLPDKAITRQQMATVLFRAYGLCNYEQNTVKINLTNVDPSHKATVQALANLGITDALKDFHPASNLKRAQFASFLVNTQDAIKHSEYIPGGCGSGGGIITPY